MAHTSRGLKGRFCPLGAPKIAFASYSDCGCGSIGLAGDMDFSQIHAHATGEPIQYLIKRTPGGARFEALTGSGLS